MGKKYKRSCNLYISTKGDNKLKFSGSESQGGCIVVDTTGHVAIAIHDGKWCTKKGKNESVIILSRYEEETCILEESIVYIHQKNALK